MAAMHLWLQDILLTGRTNSKFPSSSWDCRGKSRLRKRNQIFRILQNIPEIKVVQISDESKVTAFAGLLRNADVVVGAIFGTGFKGEPKDLQKCIIEMINMNSNAVKISVNIPSGLEADTGNSVLAIHSDFTITMYAAKSGMLSNQSATGLCGRILVANIGVPR